MLWELNDLINGVPRSVTDQLPSDAIDSILAIRGPLRAHHRYRARQDFVDFVRMMKVYVHDSPERALLTGICWIDENLIAVKVAQLSKVARVGKTQLNEALTWISEQSLPISAERRVWLVNQIPQLNNGTPLREWSFRRLSPDGLGGGQRLIAPVRPHCVKVTAQLPPIEEISSHIIVRFGPGCSDLPRIFQGIVHKG
jgi:hypothetical protein